jgi:hypothetical protein
MDAKDMKLADIKRGETLIVRCDCGHCSEFPYGHLQRHHKLPSSTLIFDLQFRLRCQKCKSTGPFRISLLDERFRGDPGGERIVVGAEAAVLKLVPGQKRLKPPLGA